jgi:hypothetical protein
MSLIGHGYQLKAGNGRESLIPRPNWVTGGAEIEIPFALFEDVAVINAGGLSMAAITEVPEVDFPPPAERDKYNGLITGWRGELPELQPGEKYYRLIQ